MAKDDTDVADQAYELGDQVDNFVDERPLTALGLAVLAGALFARYLFSSPARASEPDHSAYGQDGRPSDFLESVRRRIA